MHMYVSLKCMQEFKKNKLKYVKSDLALITKIYFKYYS
jgi:hypothetical protein